MESIYILLGICTFVFLLYSLYEFIMLKKEVNKLSGIISYLLKDHSEKK